MDNIWIMLLLQLILIALNAVFACAEIAVITISENKLERMAADGNKKAVRLQKLKGQPARFLATIQVAITLSGFLGSAFAADNFSDRLVGWLVDIGVPVSVKTLDTAAVVLITLVLSYFTLVLGELVPKRLAMRKAEKLALAMEPMIYTISKLFAPLVSLLTASTNGVLRLMGINPSEADSEDVSEEDIKMLADAGNKIGAIDNDEKNFIHNIFEFDDLTAAEIATHRTDVEILWLEDVDDWDRIIREGECSCYPVCNETVDKIVGVLKVRDYFKLKENDRKTTPEKVVKPAYFVPENVKADVLFKNMKHTHNSFAIVLDEYGGMSGIITMNDLIEQLVGDFDPDISEDAEAPDIKEVVDGDERYWEIRGSTPLSDVEEALGITFEESDCDTFGGYIFGVIGAVPGDGCQLEITTDGLSVEITEIADHQLVRSVVRFVPKEKETESADAAGE